MSQPQQPDYATALATAAALQARPEVDPLDTIEQLIDGATASLGSIQGQVTERIRQAFLRIDPYDGEQVEEFTVYAAQQMRAAQSAVSTVVAGNQRAQFRAAGLNVPSLEMSNPAEVRGPLVTIGDNGLVEVERPDELTVFYQSTPERTQVPDTEIPDVKADAPDVKPAVADPVVTRVNREDYSTKGIFNRPARTYRYERSRGARITVSVNEALVKIDTLVEDNLMLAQRLAEHEALAQAADLDSRVIGYRRVIHPELSTGGVCGMCIVASDRVYKIRELKAIHGGCWCTVTVITKDFDPGKHLNKVDLARFYKDAGESTANAHLKATRYQVDEHGELGAVLVPVRRPKKGDPESSGERNPSGKRTSSATPEETSGVTKEFAALQVVVMQGALDRLLAEGRDEDDPAVKYNRRMIAKFRKQTSA